MIKKKTHLCIANSLYATHLRRSYVPSYCLYCYFLPTVTDVKAAEAFWPSLARSIPRTMTPLAVLYRKWFIRVNHHHQGVKLRLDNCLLLTFIGSVKSSNVLFDRVLFGNPHVFLLSDCSAPHNVLFPSKLDATLNVLSSWSHVLITFKDLFAPHTIFSLYRLSEVTLFILLLNRKTSSGFWWDEAVNSSWCKANFSKPTWTRKIYHLCC